MRAHGAVVAERCLPVDFDDVPERESESVIGQINEARTEAEVLEITTAHFPHGTAGARLRCAGN